VLATAAEIILRKLAGLPCWICYSKNKSKENSKNLRSAVDGRQASVPELSEIALLPFGGEMAKAKTKTAEPKNSAPRVDSKARTADEIQKVRNRVINVIFNNSEEMAKRVVQSVTEGGQVAALKYLWEMSGMFPFEAGENGERESLAKILLERMGLQGKVPVIVGDEDGDVESDEDLAKSD
jgi:hypothetical protein